MGTTSRSFDWPGAALVAAATLGALALRRFHETPNGEVLMPFIKAFAPTVDVAKGEITVTPPGGLFEELPED
jgi:ribosomal 30S subunit maturation factor RimM